MGLVVLAVGVLMVVAGAYEMVTGSGDLLSERGWSAYIVGAVLIGSGTVTGALGLTLRALERLGLALPGSVALPSSVVSDRHEPAVVETLPLDHPRDVAPMGPGSAAVPVMTAVPAGLALAEVAHAHETFHEPAPPEPAFAMPAPEVHPPEPSPELSVAGHVPAPEVAPAETPHDDWLDHNFAELEREMAGHQASVPHHAEPDFAPVEPVHEPEPVHVEPHAAHEPEPHAEPEAYEPEYPHHPEHEPPAHEGETAVLDGATVSAREAPPPAASPVIGRYESEGTSYVMYADGSIDAQSDAGVYRFASMAELKTFIES